MDPPDAEKFINDAGILLNKRDLAEKPFTVFELKLSQVKRLGYIDAGVQDDPETIQSAVPFVEILENTGGYTFTFTRDVTVIDKKTYQYKTISKQSIKYIYDGAEDIKEIID